MKKKNFRSLKINTQFYGEKSGYVDSGFGVKVLNLPFKFQYSTIGSSDKWNHRNQWTSGNKSSTSWTSSGNYSKYTVKSREVDCLGE